MTVAVSSVSAVVNPVVDDEHATDPQPHAVVRNRVERGVTRVAGLKLSGPADREVVGTDEVVGRVGRKIEVHGFGGVSSLEVREVDSVVILALQTGPGTNARRSAHDARVRREELGQRNRFLFMQPLAHASLIWPPPPFS